MTIKDLKKYPEMTEPQLRPRYSGVATFFRTPLVDTLKDVDIGVIGVPFDGGVTNRTGTRHGPRAVREQTTLVRRVNQATGVTPFDLVSVADCGDAFLEAPYELIGAHKEIEDLKNHKTITSTALGAIKSKKGRHDDFGRRRRSFDLAADFARDCEG
mgnify:CR=1 FL=1